MSPFAHKKCAPCNGHTPPLTSALLEKFMQELGGEWLIINEHHLEKEFSFKDFKEALEFTNKIGELADQENHHPNIHLAWGRVRVVLWTHALNALSENDFILAAKIDQLLVTS